jgi:hypothetical protein
MGNMQKDLSRTPQPAERAACNGVPDRSNPLPIVYCLLRIFSFFIKVSINRPGAVAGN